MRHHKTDIGDRAADIADNETRKERKRTGENSRRWSEIWLKIYQTILLEFHGA